MTDTEENFTLPKYETPGRILVDTTGRDKNDPLDEGYAVLDWDGGSSVFWINEGIGIEEFLDEFCDFPEPGVYVVEGITGEWVSSSRGEDFDYEDWNFTNIRKATDDEVSTGELEKWFATFMRWIAERYAKR